LAAGSAGGDGFGMAKTANRVDPSLSCPESYAATDPESEVLTWRKKAPVHRRAVPAPRCFCCGWSAVQLRRCRPCSLFTAAEAQPLPQGSPAGGRFAQAVRRLGPLRPSRSFLPPRRFLDASLRLWTPMKANRATLDRLPALPRQCPVHYVARRVSV